MNGMHRKNTTNASAVQKIISSKWFPGLFQCIGLLAFLGLSICGFYGTTEAFRYTNITSFWVWCVWWPGLVLLTLLSSRLWCSICPLRLITKLTEPFGLQIKVPKKVRENRVFIIIGFFALHTIIVSYRVHHFSWLTAVYLLSLMGFALFVALLFEKGAFCNSFCPLNGFIGAYSKLGTIRLDSSDKELCKTCRTKDCYHTCPSHLCMGAMKDSETCVMCFDCVKACPNKNIELRTQSPLRSLWKVAGTLPVMLTVVILLGIMLDEFGEEWSAVEHIVTYVPTYLSSLGVPDTIWGYEWLSSLWVTFLLPLLIVLGSAGVACILTGRNNLMGYAKKYSPAFLPLIFSMHLGKMVHTLNTKLGYSQFIATDILGTQTVKGLASGALQAPAAIMPASTEGWIIFTIISLGLAGSIAAVQKIARTVESSQTGIRNSAAFSMTALLLGVSSLFIVLNWFSLY